MNVFEIEIHPAADAFPMIPSDELEELTEDIAENGLREPIVLQETDEGMLLVDGRNRREACRRLGLEPEVRYLNGEDARAYIWSTNGTRRHLSKGVKAIAYAQMYPEPSKGGRGIKGSKNMNTLPNHNYLAQARTCLRHQDLVEQVMSGAKSLDDAYKIAKERDKLSADGADFMEELREKAPDLAALVSEEELSLEDAVAALRERERVAKQQRYSFRRALQDAFKDVDAILMQADLVVERNKDHEEEFAKDLGMSFAEAARKAEELGIESLAKMLAEMGDAQ